ncbi:MAG: WG repeat-containing protein [Firmicutes bacterium]|nr:WG repeat-containing protein [Bacillota bacterium]
MNKGKRYEGMPKLNYKKILGVLIAILVVIMIIVTVAKVVQKGEKKITKPAVSYFSSYTNGEWGVIDNNGNTVIEPKYDEMIVVPNKNVPVFICAYSVDDASGTYKAKAVNEQNNEILTGYDTIQALDNYDSKQNIWYEDNVLKVSKAGKYGLIDFSGKEILPCEYDDITTLKGAKSNILVTKAGSVGLVKGNGQTIIPSSYKDIKILKDGYTNSYIIIDANNKYGIISTSGKVAISPKYDSIKYINSGNYYATVENGVLELVNTDGGVFLSGKYDDITNMNNDNAVVVKGGKYGIANKDGTEKVAPSYDSLTYAFGDFYIAKKGDKFGAIDSTNKTVLDFTYISIMYTETGNFIEADVSDTATDIFDSSFNKKLTGIVSELNTDSGYIQMRIDDNYKYYNFKFEEEKSSDALKANNLFLSKKDNKYGYVDVNGNVVIDYTYDDAKEQNAYGYAAVKLGGLWGAIDKVRKSCFRAVS